MEKISFKISTRYVCESVCFDTYALLFIKIQ